MDIRPYQPADRESCLALDPNFDATAGSGFVLVHEDAILGCAGYTLTPPAARLTHIVIRPDVRRKALGRFLLMYCLREISRAGDIETVIAEPPPEASPFFLAQGFHPAHAHQFIKKLKVCQ
jgi:N-acetylglutamate synthase-like GNAT family acetyltransferase